MLCKTKSVHSHWVHRNCSKWIFVQRIDIRILLPNQVLFRIFDNCLNPTWLSIICLFWSIRLRHLLYHVESVIIPDKNELDSASFHVCETFKSQHLQDLLRELPSTKRYTVILVVKLWLTSSTVKPTINSFCPFTVGSNNASCPYLYCK